MVRTYSHKNQNIEYEKHFFEFWWASSLGKTRGGQVFRFVGSLVVVVLLFFFGFGVSIILYTIFLCEFCFVLSFP